MTRASPITPRVRAAAARTRSSRSVRKIWRTLGSSEAMPPREATVAATYRTPGSGSSSPRRTASRTSRTAVERTARSRSEIMPASTGEYSVRRVAPRTWAERARVVADHEWTPRSAPSTVPCRSRMSTSAVAAPPRTLPSRSRTARSTTRSRYLPSFPSASSSGSSSAASASRRGRSGSRMRAIRRLRLTRATCAQIITTTSTPIAAMRAHREAVRTPEAISGARSSSREGEGSS